MSCACTASVHDLFASLGIDVDAAMKAAAAVPVSIHCWQGDDVGGFEHETAAGVDGGLAVTGNYPGKARTPGELRADLEEVLRLVPGVSRVNLHACYAEFDSAPRVDRDAITVEHFRNWMDWAKAQGVHLDFNPTFFAHPKAADGLPLTNRDPAIRDFWVEHGKRCREISAAMGRELGSSVLDNFWTPDGMKDTPADRLGSRRRLAESLDRIFAETIDPALTVESVESKLFGVGCESFTPGSNEFYLGYAASRGKFLCLDAGHFHPTEVISDKLSAVYDFVPGIALHVSRPVRWDSDHVVTLNDELLAIAQELVGNDLFPKTRVGLDYFDASIHRVAAWAIGARNMRKALLMAFLTPFGKIREAEAAGDYTTRLALQEAFKTLPFGAVWDEFCERHGAPGGLGLLREVKAYEAAVTSKR
ncbi:MAG: L-rhamnose isomerase [Kiritimatiellia bacterium]|jgi:L-rhamnose isomerase